MVLTFFLVYIKKQSWMLTKVVRIDFNHNNYCNREEESPVWTELNFTRNPEIFFLKIRSARGKAPTLYQIPGGQSKNLGRWVNPEGITYWVSPRTVTPRENILPPEVQYGHTECFFFFFLNIFM